MVLLKYYQSLKYLFHYLYLHSTMVLLKLTMSFIFYTVMAYLHSTMVLLKFILTFPVPVFVNKSTFHYGSIKM